MTKTLELSKPTLLVAVAAAMLLTGCAAPKDAQPLGNAPGPIYETAEEIQAMPSCKAVVVQRVPCSTYLRTADGKGFYIGSPGSKADVGHFLDMLKEGRTYKLPDAFVKYQEQRRLAGQ